MSKKMQKSSGRALIFQEHCRPPFNFCQKTAFQTHPFRSIVGHTFVESHTFAMGITGKGYGRKNN